MHQTRKETSTIAVLTLKWIESKIKKNIQLIKEIDMILMCRTNMYRMDTFCCLFGRTYMVLFCSAAGWNNVFVMCEKNHIKNSQCLLSHQLIHCTHPPIATQAEYVIKYKTTSVLFTNLTEVCLRHNRYTKKKQKGKSRIHSESSEGHL